MTLRVEQINRYPVKGLSGESLAEAELAAGHGIAFDRRFALAHGSRAPASPVVGWMEKNSFLILSRHAKLAQIETTFDGEAGVLTIRRDGKQVARGNITERIGRALIEEFFAAFMGAESHGPPRLVEAEKGAMFSDISVPSVSLINLASVRDLERVVGKPVEPWRFRGNILIDGGSPWEEFSWVDREITVGDATLRVLARIPRCPATNVNPGTAERDLGIPLALQRGFGHTDFGVYAEVIGAGTLRPGDEVAIS